MEWVYYRSPFSVRFSISLHINIATWFVQKTAKSLLGVCETSVVSVCLSDPPHTAVSDLADVFRQPSHIVSLTLTPLHGRAEEMEMRNGSRAGDSGRNWDHHQQSLLAAPSGLYQPPRPSPLSSPGTKRRSAKLSGKEMDKLLAALEEVSQSLERTQTQCAAIARRCEEREREQAASGGEDTDYASDDTRVERLLKVADNLTTHIINHQQQQSPRRSPTPATTGLLCAFLRCVHAFVYIHAFVYEVYTCECVCWCVQGGLIHEASRVWVILL